MSKSRRLSRLVFAWLLTGAAGAALCQPAPSVPPEFKEVRVAESAFSRGDPVPVWVEPLAVPAADTGKPLVIRLADTQFRVNESPSLFVHRAVQANSASSLGQIGQYPLYFVPAYQRLRLHSVRLLRSGEVLERTGSVGIRFLQRETGLESAVYSGMVTAMLLLEDVRIHDTLELMYSIDGENPVFGGQYSQLASWDEMDPVLHRRVVLSHPGSRRIEWRMIGDYRQSRVQPRVSERDSWRRLEFEERDIAAVDLEQQLPLEYLPLRMIQFSEFREWADVAKWGADLFRADAPIPDAVRPVIERLRAQPTRDAKISAALQWVQSEIRYFSLALGESSHRPYPPETVLQRRYGDCKDKSLLLISLLRELGIEARAALVSLSWRRGIDRYLPSPLPFDHVVVQVESEGRTHYIDPTRLGQRGALSRMGQALEGSDALVLHADTNRLAKIASTNIAGLSRHEVAERLAVPKLGGEGTLEVLQTYHGVAAESMRVSLVQVSPDQLRSFVLWQYERRYPGIEIVGEPSVRDDADANRITVASRFKIPKLGTQERNAWIVPFYPRNFVGALPLPENTARRLPVAIRTHPYEARYSLEVVWPENVSVMHDPVTNLLDNKYFSAEATRSFRGNRSKVELIFRTKEYAAQAQDLRALYEDLDRTNRLVRGFVAVSATDLKRSGLLGLETLQEQIRERLQAVISQTTQTIQRGNLQRNDLAEAHCARAEAHADLGAIADALKDSREAVRLAPSLARAYECRGNTLFASGDFAAAVADYSKAVGLGGPDFTRLYRRGHARFYLDRFDEAAADFAQASALRPGEDGIYADLWLASALQRLGRGLPKAIVQRARQDTRGDWPLPALAMLAGELTPQEMLATVERMQGDEKEMNLAEAWFYLGQYRLARNEPTMARDAFQKVREKGITVYIEHVAAGFELRNLPSR